MKPTVDRAIVLSRTNYGERDRVITFLGQNSGKITVFAKGVRAQKSRLAGGVELLSTADITFIQGKTDLRTLTGSRLISHFNNITADINRMQQAFDVLKIVGKLTEDGSGQEYYDMLANYFVALDDFAYDPSIAETWFNLRLLSLSGSAPSTEGLDSAHQQFSFDIDSQVFSHHPNGVFSQQDIKLIKLLMSQAKPIKLKEPLGSEARLLKLSKLLLQTNVAC